MSRTLFWLSVVAAIWSPRSVNAGPLDADFTILQELDMNAAPGGQVFLNDLVDRKAFTIMASNPQTNDAASNLNLVTGANGVGLSFAGETGDSIGWSIEIIYPPDTSLSAGQYRFGILGESTGDHPTEEVSWSIASVPEFPTPEGTVSIAFTGNYGLTIGIRTPQVIQSVVLAGSLTADSTAGVRIQSISFTPVPEPSSMFMGLSSIAAMTCFLRRTRSRF